VTVTQKKIFEGEKNVIH